MVGVKASHLLHDIGSVVVVLVPKRKYIPVKFKITDWMMQFCHYLPIEGKLEHPDCGMLSKIFLR